MRAQQLSNPIDSPAVNLRTENICTNSYTTTDSRRANRSGFFHQVDPKIQQQLRKASSEYHFSKGERLLTSGEKGSGLHILLVGRVKACRKGPERQLCLSILQAGDCFGELSAIDNLETTADIEAMESGKALIIPRQKLNEFLRYDAKFMQLFLCQLTNSMRNTIDNVCAIALDDVYGRLRRILYRLARQVNGCHLIEDITHLELSEMVGASREMVSIIVKELRIGGYVETCGKSIKLKRTLPLNR